MCLYVVYDVFVAVVTILISLVEVACEDIKCKFKLVNRYTGYFNKVFTYCISVTMVMCGSDTIFLVNEML